ncbi:hypothetical protein J4458_05870 [Candidatus Woesearchaeota archaeon]|nr:hypothetical protein [Candidatus Woesearchaeota archaeon]
MNDKTKAPSLVDRLEMTRTFSESGEIVLPEGVTIKGIADSASTYLAELRRKFREIGEDLTDLVMELTDVSYASFHSQDFLDMPSDREKPYSAQEFLDSLREISFEMQDMESLQRFYELARTNLSHSNKFIYNLVVNNLRATLNEAKSEEKYSKKRFTRFVLDVLEAAIPIEDKKKKDKWATFRPQYELIKSRHYPIMDGDHREDAPITHKQSDITMDYIRKILSEGETTEVVDGKEIKIPPAKKFYDETDFLSIKPGGAGEGATIIKFTIYRGDPKNPYTTRLSVNKRDTDVISLIQGICEIGLANRDRLMGHSVDYIGMMGKTKNML